MGNDGLYTFVAQVSEGTRVNSIRLLGRSVAPSQIWMSRLPECLIARHLVLIAM